MPCCIRVVPVRGGLHRHDHSTTGIVYKQYLLLLPAGEHGDDITNFSPRFVITIVGNIPLWNNSFYEGSPSRQRTRVPNDDVLVPRMKCSSDTQVSFILLNSFLCDWLYVFMGRKLSKWVVNWWRAQGGVILLCIVKEMSLPHAVNAKDIKPPRSLITRQSDAADQTAVPSTVLSLVSLKRAGLTGNQVLCRSYYFYFNTANYHNSGRTDTAF